MLLEYAKVKDLEIILNCIPADQCVDKDIDWQQVWQDFVKWYFKLPWGHKGLRC